MKHSLKAFVKQMQVSALYLNGWFLKNAVLKKFLTIKNGCFFLIETSKLKDVIYFFKTSLLNRQKTLLDIEVIDNGCKKKRFLIIYVLGNLELSTKTHICVFADDTEKIPSICKLFRGANWLEREIWDLMGINFYTKNKKRILSDYSVEGHYLRKNHPRSGFYESKKKENAKIYVKVRTKSLQKKTKKKMFA